MGDSRYDAYYARVRSAGHRPSEIRALPDEGVIAALASSALHGDRYVANILATEAMNRLRQPRMRRHLPIHSAGRDDRRLAEAMVDVQPGQHLCLLHETREEQFEAAVTYIRGGLERGEHCVYIADVNDSHAILEELRAQGMEPEPHVASGALLVLTKKDAYLRDGSFDPDQMIQLLRDTVAAAEAAGYAGVRVTGEMTWALGGDMSSEHLLEYESKLNEFFRDSNASAICQYDRCRFEAETLVGVVQTHPQVVHHGKVYENFYHVPPEQFQAPHAAAEATLERLLQNMRARADAEEEILRLNQDLEHVVAERTAELRDAVRELESFSYTVSHDLRAPLRGIDFYAQALEEDHGQQLDEDGLNLLGRLRNESQRLGALVSHLLTLGSVTRAEVRPVPLDLSLMAREVVDTLRASEPSRQVDVTIEDDLECVGDPHLVRMLLQNLLSNAWKFTRRTATPQIRFGRSEDDETVFEVRDNGAGFDPAVAHRLFNAFSRLHAAADFEGNGVGLATVARVARRHGGAVWADGRPGEGATFWFTLPGLVVEPDVRTRDHELPAGALQTATAKVRQPVRDTA